jgi:signal transduction histidine kinase
LLAAEENSKAMMMEKARHEFDIAVLRAEEIRQIMEKDHNQETVRLRHEREIIEIHREEERGSMEKEREQMVSLIGNIAHDLKTPLQSFRMDLELLKSGMIQNRTEGKILASKGPSPKSPLSKGTSSKEEGTTTQIDPFAILESLDIASIHMTMGINRFIDYAKASGGIALVPSMETFNLATAFVMPVNFYMYAYIYIYICIDVYIYIYSKNKTIFLQ